MCKIRTRSDLRHVAIQEKQTSKHTHVRLQWSHASMGLAQAHLNYMEQFYPTRSVALHYLHYVAQFWIVAVMPIPFQQPLLGRASVGAPHIFLNVVTLPILTCGQHVAFPPQDSARPHSHLSQQYHQQQEFPQWHRSLPAHLSPVQPQLLPWCLYF